MKSESWELPKKGFKKGKWYTIELKQSFNCGKDGKAIGRFASLEYRPNENKNFPWYFTLETCFSNVKLYNKNYGSSVRINEQYVRRMRKPTEIEMQQVVENEI